MEALRNDTLTSKSFWAGEHLEAEFVHFVVRQVPRPEVGRSADFHRNLLPVHIRGQWAGLLEGVFPNMPERSSYLTSRLKIITME